MRLEILYEDNHCLVVSKPAGLLSQADATGDPCLVELARDDLKARYRKPGNVYLALLHRLDRPTSGAVLLARTSKAAARLAAQFRAGTVQKLYWAIVEGRPPELAEGEWTDVVRKERALNRVEIVKPETSGGRIARVAYRVQWREEGLAKLELRPLTGRGHQLRVQLAHRGMPIVGDRKYGARSALKAEGGRRRIALHARELRFRHPTRGEEIAVVAPVPADWPEFWPGWRERPSGSGKPRGN